MTPARARAAALLGRARRRWSAVTAPSVAPSLAPAAAPALVGLLAAAVLAGGVVAVGTGEPVPAVQAARAVSAPQPLQPAVEALPVPAAAATGAPAVPAAATPAAAPSAPPAPSVPVVAPLAGLRAADLVVRVPDGASAEQLARLQGVEGVEAVAALDVVRVEVAGQPAVLAGVDPSGFRAFTPQPSAASDALWQVVARGELVAAHGLREQRGVALGGRLPQGRVGAVAALGVPGLDLVADRATAARLGATAGSVVVVAAPERSVRRLRAAVREVLGDVEVDVLRPEPVAAAPVGRPSTYRELYQSSARLCPGLSWTVLAAVGQIESGHGRNLGPSSAGALGPMQFMPATWAAYGVDGDGDGRADIMSPHDAVPSAALYLCRFGGGRGGQGLYDALFAYNHADWYVRKVLALAAQYR